MKISDEIESIKHQIKRLQEELEVLLECEQEEIEEQERNNS